MEAKRSSLQEAGWDALDVFVTDFVREIREAAEPPT